MGLIEKKKNEKRQKLLNSAYACFTKQGISNTSIAEICRMASVAKGTFYLYFRDKEDIARALNQKLTFQLLNDSFAHMNQVRSPHFCENLIRMADFVILRFEEDIDLIRFIHRDFVWPIRADQFSFAQEKDRIPGLETVQNYALSAGLTTETVLLRIYCMIAMIISVSYDAIVEHDPSSIQEMRPVLYSIIQSSFPDA